ncbi:Uncharacterised protein [uncultured Coprococcus sp.]|nr:Uncharacterised protein [uncultured Coprococcus sp.]
MLLFMKITVFDITVLIDTWWNVNEFIDTIKRTCNLVLIDTWWNVNKTLDDIYILLHWVLIDTWWNVNSDHTPTYGQYATCFNRYMVECEYRKNQQTIYHFYRFNRYMVECES